MDDVRSGRGFSNIAWFAPLAVALMALGGCLGFNAPDEGETVSQPATPRQAQKIPHLVESFATLAESEPAGDVPWPAAITLARVCVVVYDDADQQQQLLKGIGATTVRSIDKGSSHGVVASTDSAVVIGFRGTKDPADWLTDATIVRERVANGGMHRGFYNAVAAIFDDVYAEALKQGAADKTVWITGHSLGGAMAMVFAYRAMTEKNLMADGVITFGQPLVFTTPLAQTMLEKYNCRYVRFVNEWDPVTRLIPTYRHAGVRVHLDNGTFTVRKPMLSFEVQAGAPADNARNPQASEDADLAPMSEDEYGDFLNVVAEEKDRAGEPNAQLSLGGIALFKPHLMGTYIDHLQEIESRAKAPPAKAQPLTPTQAKPQPQAGETRSPAGRG